MKRALIFIGYFALILMLLGAGGAGYLYYNQEKIIAGGVAKLNEQLKAPVEVSLPSPDKTVRSASCAGDKFHQTCRASFNPEALKSGWKG